METTANIIIDIFILIFASVGILSSLSILFLIFRYRQHSPFTTTTLLLCNNYIAAIFCCSLLAEMYSHNLYGHLHLNVSFDNWYCYIRAYLIMVTISLVYYSYLLQACFRLFRIVFHKYRKLQSFSYIVLLIFLQWLVLFLSFLPGLFLNLFSYVTPNYYYCQALYTYTYGLMYLGMLACYFPMGLIGLIYFYIVYYMKKRSNQAVQRSRQLANQRDFIVVRRIILLIGMLFMVTFPAVVIYFWYFITGYLYSLTYQFQWLTLSIGLSILPAMTAILTPQLRDLFKRQFQPNQRIQPVLPIQQLELQRRNAVQTTQRL